MSCLPEPSTFRLLDGIVGWDVRDATHLEGLDDITGGVALARRSPNAVDPADLLPYLPPARLARGCGRCDWYLVTPIPSRLLHLACGVTPPPCQDPYPCGEAFVPIPCLADPRDGVAVAARRHAVAVSDRGARQVLLFEASGAERLATIALADPGPLAFTPWGDLLVSGGTVPQRLRRFSRSGAPRADWPAPLPVRDGSVDRMAFANDCALWLVMMAADGSLTLWRATRESPEFVRADPRDLAASFAPTNLIVSTGDGFCLRDTPQGPACCFDWYGRPSAVPPARPGIPRASQGQLLTLPIDSGKPRCRWHRVRVEATVPAGTSIAVAVATSEAPAPLPQGDPHVEAGWETFPAGVPHPADWDAAPQGSLDYMIRQPPGRYQHLRVRLRGDGVATPIVHRIRLDFPRSTGLEYLPSVYREDPRAEEFTERFLALFDATVEDLDRAIDRFPAMLDVAGTPPSVLPWLATFLDLAFEASWSAERRRALLAATPDLYRRRGTREGLARAIRLVLGVEPAIEELAASRPWGAVSRSARLGSVRLFGMRRARFTVGASALCAAPLRGYGDPALDPLAAPAWRLRVLIPGTGPDPEGLEDRLVRLLDSQKPAHAVATTRVGGKGFIVGSWSAAGVDTALVPLPAPVLGGPRGNARLSRMTVLWSRRGARASFSVGRSAAVGIHSVSA